MMELHPVVMRDGPHKSARWHPESPLMEGNEADHVALRWCRFSMVGRQLPPLRQIPASPRTQENITHELL
jgi:hypothetical protein